jgi:hypothetical protein
LSNVTSTVTPFASAKLERHFSSSAKNDLRAAKRGPKDCASARFLRSVVAPFTVPRIVTQEKGFSEDYLRVLRFSWGRRLDDPNQLVPNFNRYVSRFSQNVCGIMERFAFDEQIDVPGWQTRSFAAK